MVNNRRLFESGNTLELVLSLAWGLTGWFLPKYFLMLAANGIVEKDESDVFQVVNNAVVYDFLLKKPLVNPPTVPSK